LGYTFWCSVSTPELLVVAFHQTLFIASEVLPFIIHSSLITFLREQYGTGRTSFTTLRLFTLADSALPISPTHVAAVYPPL
jgi:hypothetical protein